MPRRPFLMITAAFATILSAGVQAPPAAPSATDPSIAATHAKGAFDVKVSPLKDEGAGDPLMGRMALDKVFHGDLEATSRGQMLTAGTAVKGSAGYVAMETVTGTLRGRKGSFVLQHSGTMRGGAFQLAIAVVPDSGTAGLAGIGGTMTITITEGKHFYDFAYRLPPAVEAGR